MVIIWYNIVRWSPKAPHHTLVATRAPHLAPVEKGRGQHAPGAAEAMHRTSAECWRCLIHGNL